MKKNNIILASSSLSRKKILKNTGLVFTTVNPKINEDVFKNELIKKKESPKRISKELARLKCTSISTKLKEHIVIGCDTTIDLNKKLLNKAKNKTDARKKLNQLSGKKHKIFTSVIIMKNKKILWTHSEKTEIWVRKLNKKNIEYYLKKNKKNILKSVGCYEAEKMAPYIFKKINGDFYNVMGLPILQLLNYIRIKKIGVFK